MNYNEYFKSWQTFEHSFADDWDATDSNWYFYSYESDYRYSLVYSLNGEDLSCTNVGSKAKPF